MNGEGNNYIRKSVTSSSSRMNNSSKQEAILNFYNQKQQQQQQQQEQLLSPNKKSPQNQQNVQNVEFISQLNNEENVMLQQQKHFQEIQKITSFNTTRAISTPQNININIITSSQSQTAKNSAQKNKIQSNQNYTNQPFQFFVPQKSEQLPQNNNNNNNNGLNRNSSLPLTNLTTQIHRQSHTSQNKSRKNNLSSYSQKHQNLQEEKQSIISDNNQIISSSIKNSKSVANNDQFLQPNLHNISQNVNFNIQNRNMTNSSLISTQQNSNQGISNVNYPQISSLGLHVDVNKRENSQDTIQSNQQYQQNQYQQQSKFQGNQLISQNYALGSFTPIKDDLLKKSSYNYKNGYSIISKKMNISQFNSPTSTLQSKNSSNQTVSLIQNSISFLRNQYPSTNSSTNLPNHNLEFNNNNNLINQQNDNKNLNVINNEYQITLTKANSMFNSQNKTTIKNNPPNFNEFLDREFLQKKLKQQNEINNEKLTLSKESNNEKSFKRAFGKNKNNNNNNNNNIIVNNNNNNSNMNYSTLQNSKSMSPLKSHKNGLKNENDISKSEIDKIENIGLMNYIQGIFIDCEYMYRGEIQKQIIQLNNLFDNSESKEISPLETTNKLTLLQQISKSNSQKDIRKQVERLICIEVGRKKQNNVSDMNFAIEQMNSFEEILREGLKKSLQLINAECRTVVLDIITSTLLLQTKKHMIIEKKKRDDMMLFLSGIKDKEKEFKVNIFGAEADVEAFRFKIGEIENENKILNNQIKILTEKYNSLILTHQKQRKLATAIKNEYLNLRTINSNLNQRLTQKYECLERRLSRAKIDPQLIQQLLKSQLNSQSPSCAMIEQIGSTLTQQQIDRFSFNEANLFSPTQNQLQYNSQPSILFNPNQPPLSVIQLQIPSKTNLTNNPAAISPQTKNNSSQVFIEEIENNNNNNNQIQMTMKEIQQTIQEFENKEDKEVDDLDDIDEQDEFVLENILKEAQKITKVDNHEVLIKEVNENIPVLYYNKECQTDPKITNPKQVSANIAIQTELQLLDSQFDLVMENNERIKQVSKLEEIRDQLQNVSESSDQESEMNKSASISISDEPFNPKNMYQKIKKRISIVKLLRGLPLKKRKKSIKKKEIEQFSDNIHVLKNFLESSHSLSEDDSVGSIEISACDEYEEDEIVQGGNKPTSQKKIQKQAKNTNSQTPNAKDNNNLNSGQKKGNNVGQTSVVKNQGTQKGVYNNSSVSKHLIEDDSTPQQNSNIDSKLSQRKKKQQKDNNNLQKLNNNSDLKNQILQVVKLYNHETEKCNNYEESFQQLIAIMQELFNFSYKIFNHVQKTQKDTYRSVVEQFYQQFISLRWKLPKEIDQKLEDDLFPQEAMKKKLLQRKNKQQNSKMNAPRAAAMNNKAVQKLTIQDKSVHSGIVLAKKVREVGLPKRFNGYLPLKSILKQITQIFEDRIRQIRESRLSPDTEMSIFVFNKFIHQYGFKNVAEQKYLHFLMNILNYQQIFRVNLFARLIGIMQFDEDNYTTDEMNKYITCWHFLISGSTMGSAISYNESDLRIYTHYLRALDLLKLKLENIFPQEYIQELRQFIESNKELEQKQTNKLVIDVDQLLIRVLAKYRLTMNSTKVYVKNAFLACDLDGNGSINLNEFLTLYRHIEVDKFTFAKVFKMFESHADLITQDEKCLSFQKFTSLCVQNHLFLDEAQRRFIGVRETYEIEPQFLDLKLQWQNEKQILTNYIESLKPFVQIETYEVWRDVLLVLQDRILKNQKVSKDNNQNYNEKKSSNQGSLRRINSKDDQNQNLQSSEYEHNLMPILIAHKLLKLELKRLVEVGQNDENLNDGELNSEISDEDELKIEYGHDNNNNNSNNVSVSHDQQPDQNIN